MSTEKRIFTVSMRDIDGELHRLQFTEKALLEIQKGLNLILNVHGPMAKRVDVGTTICTMDEKA